MTNLRDLLDEDECALTPIGLGGTAVRRSHIGDYVAWTLVGMGLLAVLVGV